MGLTEDEFLEVARSHAVSPYEHDPDAVTAGAKTHDFDQWCRDGGMPPLRQNSNCDAGSDKTDARAQWRHRAFFKGCSAMIAIIDYGMGNLLSVYHALEMIGTQPRICQHPEELQEAERLVLPGVGAFRDCMENLRAKGFVEAMADEVLRKGKPILGICLGMQAMARRASRGASSLASVGLPLMWWRCRLPTRPPGAARRLE